MKNLWSDTESDKFQDDLALRVYTSRLLGQEPSLVLHGGGNTSVKITETNLVGSKEDILYVKGSGNDIPIEERPIDEVTGFRDYQWAADGVSVCNPAFDVTPADLVTGLITEKGVILSPTTEKINHLFNTN